LIGLACLRLGSYPHPVLDERWWKGFVPTSIIIVVLGVIDDLRPLGAKIKFLVQIAVALGAIHFGFLVDHITLPWGASIDLGGLAIPLTVLWIVGITNAFNLIDGLDGLACGVAVIASVTLGATAVINQQIELALLCTILAGCLIGFLRYNFHPATIFLGDSGSLFLGFTLAVLSIKTSHKSTAAVSILVPLLAFGFPIMETVLSMARRFLRATHVMEATGQGTYRWFFLRGASMFEADRDHIHHRLMRLGITHQNCVVLLYITCALMGLVSLALAFFRNLNAGLVLLAMVVAIVATIQKLRYQELQLLRNGALLPLSRFPVLGYESFQIIIDIFMVVAAYYVAFLIRFEGVFLGSIKDSFIATLPAVLLTKIIVFHLSGLYQVKWQHAGISDLLKGFRAMTLGSVAAALTLSCLPIPKCSWSMLFIDFYVMSSLLLGARFSVRLLTYYARSNPARKRKVLIYGTGEDGTLLIHEILSNEHLSLTPVGFIDEDPNKHRKTLHGYPILGPSALLEEQIRNSGAQELIIATPQIAPDLLDRIKNFCRDGGITLRKFHVALEELPQH
jgi:UDP-GlcNAc:undecaprenyl-phosphate GlcNAc-1-phosphate transferase